MHNFNRFIFLQILCLYIHRLVFILYIYKELVYTNINMRFICNDKRQSCPEHQIIIVFLINTLKAIDKAFQ